DPAGLAAARREPGSIAAYLELHIEQGPYLEQWGLPLGVVTAITGFRRDRYVWDGRPDHAGTTSMERRRDALAGASASIPAIVPLTAEPPVHVPPAIQRLAQEACRTVGVEAPRLVSMAGHDANQIARLAPVGMLFVPSKDGRSHCPEEWSRLEDMALGVRALLALLSRLDQHPPRIRP